MNETIFCFDLFIKFSQRFDLTHAHYQVLANLSKYNYKSLLN